MKKANISWGSEYQLSSIQDIGNGDFKITWQAKNGHFQTFSRNFNMVGVGISGEF